MKRSFSQNMRAFQLPVFFLTASLYLEVCFHLFIFGPDTGGLAVACLFGGLFGCILAGLVTVLPKIPGCIISGGLLSTATVFAGVQLIYYAVFGSLMQLSLVRMGGDVLDQFRQLIIATILQNWYKVLLLILPLILMGLLSAHLPQHAAKKQKFAPAPVFALLLLFCVIFCSRGWGGSGSAFSLFSDKTISTEYAYQRLGLTGGAARDLLSGIFFDKNSLYAAGIESGSQSYDPAQYNMLDIDFHALAESTDDPTLQALDRYFASVAPTAKNEYTGLLSGYNLITICAESFSPYLISEELTPTLYKLSRNGILFENYYGSFQSLTSNGEYAMCTGLYPNMNGTSGATSFEDSISHYLPYCLGNSLGELGYAPYAYHNNVGEFYSRNLTHANMGYEFQAAGSGLNINLTNPSSDLELFQESVDDLTHAKAPFVAHYMSWSAHSPYDWTNVMCEKNRSAVEDLPYSAAVKAYIACNLELEYGLRYLMDTLEQAGLAEKTVIVLATDHFPYGLSAEAYNELAGFEVDPVFEKYRTSLICYVPGLAENIRMSEYCSTVDILPTLLNLFGVEYDSRLLAGKDVFSDGIHLAALSNQSFITDTMQFNAEADQPADTEAKDRFGYTQADYQNYVRNLFAVSVDILDSDYYAHVFSYESSSDGPELVQYSDIQNVFHKAAVQYVISNDLMNADSEDLFGGDRTADAGELLSGFCRISGLPAEPEAAIKWAQEAGILSDNEPYTADTPLDHELCALLMMRYAAWYGADVSVDEAAVEETISRYPDLTPESAKASLWATVETVINKSMDNIYESRGVTLTRFQLAAYLSYLCTRSLSL